MKSRFIATLTVLTVIVVFGWWAPAGAHEEFSYYGSTVGGPQFNRPSTTAPFTPTGVIVSYSSQPFQVNQTTTCTVFSIQNSINNSGLGVFDGFIHVYANSFNPVNSSANVLVANDDGTLGVGSSQTATFTAQANTPHFVVTSSFATGTNGDFQNVIACSSSGLANPLLITHGGCSNTQNGTRTCLSNDRFLVSATVTQVSGTTPAQVVQFGAGNSALFWFLTPQNWELLVKIINFCGAPENAWRVFAAGTTTFGVDVTVTDTVRGGTIHVLNTLNSNFQNQVIPIPNSCP